MASVPAPASKKQSGLMRPPLARPSSKRPQGNAASGTSRGRVLSGTISPAESTASQRTISQSRSPTSQTAGTKRKERDFEQDPTEETNIHVVVRCRGRSEREVRENSGVVLATDGVKGRSVELSMGPNALGNKTYHFDRVFSPAADQSMISDEVVAPILDEMLLGFNCTIFAYGQTGTGKTYTMAGDIADNLGLVSESAGIIPRLLHSLFTRLEEDECESAVKCSFIELYNEELRDLLSVADGTKLKIYEDSTKKLQGATYVQGMEETYIKDAVDGIRLLRTGSHKRQVAATKCNDLSSRSHTIFTVTTYVKRTSETGEDFVSAGKLNLVDLAGSENIQRSGAENKRAAEAGLINKSLLTLGRVINALVDKSSHIPYRESKLTRLLQDSLGGHTKTCIIATVSSAKSNLEETISTLDYAFRAKNIRNKPQVNQMVSKRTLLREFTSEIERLKFELIAARQKNGVYLAPEAYDNIVGESESRRILNEEQKAKIETMETTLRNRVQELFSLTTSFNSLKKENDGMKLTLDETKGILEQTEMVLANTRQSLAEESLLRRAHQKTEESLHAVGGELLSTLGNATSHVNGLQSKLRRRSDLHARNRQTWETSQQRVADVTHVVKMRLDDLETQQKGQAAMISAKLGEAVREQMRSLTASQALLHVSERALEEQSVQMSDQTELSRDDMDQTLEHIKILRENVKQGVSQALRELSAAAGRISADVVDELVGFHHQLHASYSSLGRDFRTAFEDLLGHLNSQKAEADQLRRDILLANSRAVEAHRIASSRLECVLAEERQQAAAERQKLLAQISSLVYSSGEAQDARWAKKIGGLREDIHTSRIALEGAQSNYREGMDAWTSKEKEFVEGTVKARETLKLTLKQGWTEADRRNSSIQATTQSIHEKTLQIVDVQMSDIHDQMQSLDEFVTRARSQNHQHHEAQRHSLLELTSSVKQTYLAVGDQFQNTSEQVQALERELSEGTDALLNTLSPLDADVHQPLTQLQNDIVQAPLEEYAPTGETPQKTHYQYPTTLPKTDAHKDILARNKKPHPSSSSSSTVRPHDLFFSPSKSTATTTTHHIFTDDEGPDADRTDRPLSSNGGGGGGLRELDVNVKTGLLSTDLGISSSSGALHQQQQPPLKRRNTAIESSKLPHPMMMMKVGKFIPSSSSSSSAIAAATAATTSVVKLEGRENQNNLLFSSLYAGRSRPGQN